MCFALYFPDNAVKRDFSNNVINFTLSPGEDHFDIDMLNIINVDGINEAEEEFILVLEYSSNAELELDEDGGFLVVTILDDNRKTKCSVFKFLWCYFLFSNFYSVRHLILYIS